MFASLQCAIGALLLAFHIAAQDVSVSLYPTVDPARLAQAFNISEDCLEALYVVTTISLIFHSCIRRTPESIKQLPIQIARLARMASMMVEIVRLDDLRNFF